MATVWIVAPCYRDGPSFSLLRADAIEALKLDPVTAPMQVRFVLIDDTGGLDPDLAELASLADTRVIEPPFNLGHQRALVYALRTMSADLADDDLVVTLDADGQDGAEDIPRLVAAVLDNESPGAVALAGRTTRPEPLGFKLSYAAFKLAFRVLTGTVIRTGNFAAYRAFVAQRLLLHPYFDLCYSSTFVSLDVPRTVVPCPRRERYEGRSRMNRSRLLMHGLRMLMPFLDRIAQRAIVGCSVILTLAVGGSIAAWAVGALTDATVPSWATYGLIGGLIVSLVALSSSLALFASFAQSRGVSLIGLEQQQWTPHSKRTS